MGNNKRDIWKRAIALLSITGMLALMIILIVYSKLQFNVGVLCPFKEILNLECPGCGGTRMAVSLLHLDFYQAFRYNPYVCISIPFLVYVFIRQSYVFIFKNEILEWLDKFLIIYAIGMITFGILRNISLFSWLAPTYIGGI